MRKVILGAVTVIGGVEGMKLGSEPSCTRRAIKKVTDGLNGAVQFMNDLTLENVVKKYRNRKKSPPPQKEETYVGPPPGWVGGGGGH